MIRIKLLTILLLLFMSEVVSANSLTLEQFLTQIVNNHPFFKKETIKPDILKTQQQALLGDEDWYVNATTRLAHEESGINNAFTAEKTNNANLDVSLNRAYWLTGGQVSLAYSLARSSQDFSQGKIKSYQNNVSLQYVHPLLKNVNGILSQLNYQLQNYSIQNSELNMLEAKENFLADLSDKYLDWVLQTELRRINDERLAISQTELTRSQKKRANNLVPKVDVIRAKTAYIQSKQSLHQTQTTLSSILAELAVITQDNKFASLTPSYALYKTNPLPDENQVQTHIENQSRLLNIYQIRLDQIRHNLRGLSNAKKPDLNFIVGAGLLGNDDKLGGSASIDKPQYSVALSFNYPLANRSAKANIDQAHLQKMQIEEEKNDLTLQLQSSAAAIVEQLAQLEISLTLHQEQIESYKTKTSEELKRYNQGRSELTFVLQSQDQEQQAKIAYAITATTYHKVYLRYRALMDELLKSIDEGGA